MLVIEKMRFKSSAQRRAVMARLNKPIVQYRIYIKHDGIDHYEPTKKVFSSKKKADNFSFIETLAGQGEDYISKKEYKYVVQDGLDGTTKVFGGIPGKLKVIK
jgi:hypothetical protein